MKLRKCLPACSGNSPLISCLGKSLGNLPQHASERLGAGNQGEHRSGGSRTGRQPCTHRSLWPDTALKHIQVIVSGVKEPTQTDHRVWSVLQKNIISRLCLQQACQRGMCLLTTDNKAPQAPTHTTREPLWNMMFSLERQTAQWRERGRPDRKAQPLSETSTKPESLSGTSCSAGWGKKERQAARPRLEKGAVNHTRASPEL